MAATGSKDDAVTTESAIAAVLREGLQQAFPVPPSAARLGASLPKESSRMSESGAYANGQYGGLKADVDNLKSDVSDLRGEFHTWRTDISNEIRELGKSVAASFETMRANQASGGLDLGKMAGVVSVVLTLVYFYSSLTQKLTDTNITFTNEKIATSNSVTERNLAGTNAAIASVASTVEKLALTVVPRNEADLRFERDERDLLNKVNKDVLVETDKRYAVQYQALSSDVDRLKADVVSRREHEQHWAEENDRISALATRLTAMQKDSGGASLSEQLKDLSQRFQDLQTKFVKP